MTQSNIIMLAMTPLIMWRVYKRVQRLTVRQQSRMWRHWFGVIFLPLALLTMSVFQAAHPAALASLLGGVAGGGMPCAAPASNASAATTSIRRTRRSAWWSR